MKQPAVYMMANGRNGTLYTGVTSNLPKRAFEHRQGVVAGFTTRYGCKVLVWYELHATMEGAIVREKQIKGGSRKKKLALIEAMNPIWRDLFDDLISLSHARYCEAARGGAEAIQSSAHNTLDCFVASLLAMTAIRKFVMASTARARLVSHQRKLGGHDAHQLENTCACRSARRHASSRAHTRPAAASVLQDWRLPA